MRNARRAFRAPATAIARAGATVFSRSFRCSLESMAILLLLMRPAPAPLRAQRVAYSPDAATTDGLLQGYGESSSLATQTGPWAPIAGPPVSGLPQHVRRPHLVQRVGWIGCARPVPQAAWNRS